MVNIFISLLTMRRGFHYLFSSLTQSCPVLCDPINCSTPSFLVHHLHLELTQTHVHQVSFAIQPSLPQPLLLLPSIFPSIRVFSNQSAVHIRWPKYQGFSFSTSPSNEYSGLISFRTECFYLLAVQGTLQSLLQYHSSKASIFWLSTFFMVHLSHPYIFSQSSFLTSSPYMRQPLTAFCLYGFAFSRINVNEIIWFIIFCV